MRLILISPVKKGCIRVGARQSLGSRGNIANACLSVSFSSHPYPLRHFTKDTFIIRPIDILSMGICSNFGCAVFIGSGWFEQASLVCGDIRDNHKGRNSLLKQEMCYV